MWMTTKQVAQLGRLGWWGGVLLLLGLLIKRLDTPQPTPSPQIKARENQIQKNEDLIGAIQRKDLTMVTRLLQEGANPNACDLTYPPTGHFNRDLDSRRPLTSPFFLPYQPHVLSIAVCWGTPEIVRLLLEKGADINAVDNGGNTPLLCFLRNSSRDPEGWRMGWERQRLYLPEHREQFMTQNPVDHPFILNLEMLKLLLDRGAKIEVMEKSGYTPLILAVMHQERGAVQLLLKYGANVNRTDSRGNTPLMWAASYDDIRIVEELLSHGADPNAKDPDGGTALSRAFSYKKPGVQILKQAGAKDWPVQ